MGSLIKRQQEIERRKRFVFVGLEIAGIFSTVFLSAFIGLPLIVYGIYKGLDWFKFRAKNGMKF